eukprot:1113512-Karenia_brevis.AAC.1
MATLPSSSDAIDCASTPMGVSPWAWKMGASASNPCITCEAMFWGRCCAAILKAFTCEPVS